MEESESEHGDTPKAPTPKKRLVVSGGLTGFGIAQDLLQIDFSPPEEAPEEFKAVAFYEEPKQIKPGLSGALLSICRALYSIHMIPVTVGKKKRFRRSWGLCCGFCWMSI